MLWTIIIILLVLWLLGLLGHIGGSLIHLLLVIAVVVLIVNLDAAGSAIGSIVLTVFGGIVWLCLPKFPAWLVLLSATAVWFVLSVGLWIIRKRV